MPEKYGRNEYELETVKELTIAMIQANRLTVDEDVTRFMKAAFETVSALCHGVATQIQ